MSNKKLKRLAVVASGWHYPLHFFESLLKQEVPEGWAIDYFCISHRDPSYAQEEKKTDVYADDLRGRLDAILYKEIASKRLIENLGWTYKEHPNTIGDWGNTNQWLEEHDYKDYSLFLFTHDDNLIINNKLFVDTIEDPNFKKWDICANSTGMPQGWIRGSFELFKPKVLDLLGGKFDMSLVTLTREGKTDNPEDKNELYDWNNTVNPLMDVVNEKGLRVAYMSPCYRVSFYAIEGERGYVSRTHGQNTASENEGLAYLQFNKLI